jgi:hypothetical protein
VITFVYKILNSTELWAAVLGAVVGAVAGGIIAYIVQIVALRAAAKQREDDRLASQQALATSLIFKVNRILANYIGLNRYIEECFEDAEKAGLKGEPWQFVMPMAWVPPPVEFSPDEMAVLLAQKNDELVNAMLGVDFDHNQAMGALEKLQMLRPALMEQLPPSEVQGKAGRINLTMDQMVALRPRMIEVNDLVDHLRTDAREGIKKVGELIFKLSALLNDKLKLGFEIRRLESTVQPEAMQAPTASAAQNV